MRQKIYSALTLLVMLVSIFGMISCNREGIPESGRTLFVRTQGTDLPVYLHGNAESDVVILLLHGGPGGNGLEYRSGTYAEMLEEKYVMAYLDQRGQGAARKVYGTYQVTMQTMINDVDAVVKVIKHELGANTKVYLFGHSWGGTLGTGYLVSGNHQNDVHAWIESDGAHDIPLLNKMAIAMYIQIGEQELVRNRNVEKWTEIVKWAKGVDINNISDEESGQINTYGYEAEALIDTLGASDEGGIPFRYLYSPVDPILSHLSGLVTSKALVNDGIENLSYTDQLSKLTLPTLLLWGKYDFVVPPNLGIDALDRLGSSVKSLVVFEQSGHSPMNHEAVLYAQTIIDFVEKTR